MAGLKQQKKVKAQVVEEEEVAAVEGAMAVQPGVTTSMRRSVGSVVRECLKPTLSTTSKRNTRGSEFQRRGLHA